MQCGRTLAQGVHVNVYGKICIVSLHIHVHMCICVYIPIYIIYRLERPSDLHVTVCADFARVASRCVYLHIDA